MTDMYVKNNNRGRKVVNQVEYQPEYERLNKPPVIQNFDRGELTNISKSISKKNVSDSSSGGRRVHLAGSISGQSEEVIWTQKPGATAQDQDVHGNENITDAPLPPPEEFAYNENSKQEEDNFNINSVGVGDYILVYNGDVIALGNKADIYKQIEALSLNNIVSLNEILLLKRVSVKYSLTIEE